MSGRDRLAACLLAGVVAGLVAGVYHQELEVLRDAAVVAAVVAGAVWAALSWVAHPAQLALKRVTIKALDQELEFEVSDEHRLVAWRLFIEMATRVSSQALAYGIDREALASLYALFQATRELLKTALPPAHAATEEGHAPRSVEAYALAMLNHQLRPFLSRWHASLSRHEGGGAGEWPEHDEFRRALERLRQELSTIARAFGELAGLEPQEVERLLGADGRAASTR